jgi:hypothetical protein
MQCLEERYERSGFWWTQIFPVRGHVASALDHLSNELVFVETQCNSIELRPTLSALIIQRMAVVALLRLEN